MEHRTSALALVVFSFAAVLLLLPGTAHAANETNTIDARGSARVPLGQPLYGPESLAFDNWRRGPYTGVSDGRILRWGGRRAGWTDFAYNPNYRNMQQYCRESDDTKVTEVVCGRPLGLRFHRKSGYLYIADAYLGLMRVEPGGGVAEVVATEADGVPFNFVNGLDIDQVTGVVYFTDSSTKYQRRENIQILRTRDETGRLLKFDPRTNRVTVLQIGLAYPNGVAISPDRTHLVVALTSPCQAVRHWIGGPKAGELELFADLPGYPDNVRPDRRGGYWIALNTERQNISTGATTSESEHHHLVGARVNGKGEVVELLRGAKGVTLSEVVERKGLLWLGSVDEDYVGVLRI